MANKRGTIPLKDIKLLYGRARGLCSFEDCHEDLSLYGGSDKQIGEMAHIIASSPKFARGDSKYPKDKLDKYENLILVCPKCHAKIDTDEEKYTVEVLHQIKTKHEKWAKEQLDRSMSKFGFAELEIAVKCIASGNFSSKEEKFEVISPKDKIKKNNLTETSKELITMGLSRSSTVKRFFSAQSEIYLNFTDKIKEGFQEKYMELKQIYGGDSLFEAMVEFSHGGSGNLVEQAAGLAILCHLFELCDVFEK